MKKPVILFVDDEIEILEIIQDIFKSREFEVVCTHSGDNAIRLCDDGGADVIVCDLILKDSSGMEVLSYWKKNCPGAYRILTTGYLDQLAEKKCREEEIFQKMIPKPWDIFQLREEIEHLFNEN